jgi:alcohol dehydrogenase
MEAVMPKVRVVQVGKKGGPFELVERELPQPRPGEVRVNVQACGVCHSDSIAKEGLFPTVPYPIVPGHEIAGVIDAVGDGHACRCRLVRRPLWPVRAMPPRVSRGLP